MSSQTNSQGRYPKLDWSAEAPVAEKRTQLIEQHGYGILKEMNDGYLKVITCGSGVLALVRMVSGLPRPQPLKPRLEQGREALGERRRRSGLRVQSASCVPACEY